MPWGHEEWGIVATIDPANNNNNTFLTDAVDMSRFSEIMALLVLGATDIAINFKLQEATTSGGSYADIAGKAITAFGGTDDNKQAIISLKSEELTPGKQFVKGSLTVDAGTTNINTVIVLGRAVYRPATDHDLADVAQS